MITQETIGYLFIKAVEWIGEMGRTILQRGLPLVQTDRALASLIRVNDIDRIRVGMTDTIPLPDDPELSKHIVQYRVITEDTAGVTFGHGILLKNGVATRAVLAHELGHVLQYERFGGIDAFLREYLKEVFFEPLYPNGPLEREATALAERALRDAQPGI